MQQILLVEDDLVYSKIISYILENSGYIVECAADRRQAIEMVGNKNYDLIVTDILMPRTGGFDLLNEMLIRDDEHRTKIIVLSVLSNEYYMSESLSRGADEYIKKPVSAKELVQAVKRLLHTKAA